MERKSKNPLPNAHISVLYSQQFSRLKTDGVLHLKSILLIAVGLPC